MTQQHGRKRDGVLLATGARWANSSGRGVQLACICHPRPGQNECLTHLTCLTSPCNESLSWFVSRDFSLLFAFELASHQWRRVAGPTFEGTGNRSGTRHEAIPCNWLNDCLLRFRFLIFFLFHGSSHGEHIRTQGSETRPECNLCVDSAAAAAAAPAPPLYN